LYENIAFGVKDATEEKIISAARTVGLDRFALSLPDGYQAALGENGARMSGGQRQRLAIARALVREPALLILDEATSQLDVGAEREILHTILPSRCGKTTIMVTHRLASAACADLIVVLNHGVIEEMGVHSALMARGGLYCQSFQQQSAERDDMRHLRS
jgi:ATP-binding cassette subfamily B protein